MVSNFSLFFIENVSWFHSTLEAFVESAEFATFPGFGIDVALLVMKFIWFASAFEGLVGSTLHGSTEKCTAT